MKKNILEKFFFQSFHYLFIFFSDSQNSSISFAIDKHVL